MQSYFFRLLDKYFLRVYLNKFSNDSLRIFTFINYDDLWKLKAIKLKKITT